MKTLRELQQHSRFCSKYWTCSWPLIHSCALITHILFHASMFNSWKKNWKIALVTKKIVFSGAKGGNFCATFFSLPIDRHRDYCTLHHHTWNLNFRNEENQTSCDTQEKILEVPRAARNFDKNLLDTMLAKQFLLRYISSSPFMS